MTKEFMKEAVENLIARGVAKPEDFSPSAVTDEDIAAFERRFQVTMPESLRAYLQTCSFDFEYLAAPIPEDGLDADTILDPDYECSPVRPCRKMTRWRRFRCTWKDFVRTLRRLLSARRRRIFTI